MYQFMNFIKISKEQDVGIVSINNPPVNALSKAVFKEILDSVQELKQSPEIKAIIIMGEGAIFAAGADIKEIQNVNSQQEGEAISLESHKVINEISNSDIPVIAAINGPCLGGGNELAMACHIRIATDKARFGQPEINIGIVPGMGGTQRLPRYVGTSKAIELLLSGDLISSQEAKSLGLVNLVVPESELKKQALGLAKKFTSKSKVAMAAILKAVREGVEKPLDEGLKIEAKQFGLIMTTEDKKEGIQAFVEKRAPSFKNH